MRHLVRFGSHNEQSFFCRPLSDTFEGIAFNANLVAWSGAGIASFLCGQNLVDKLTLIDPLTHAFQHDPSALTNEENQVKASVQQLVEQYGQPILGVAGNTALLPSEFNGDDLKLDFTRRVVAFQSDTLEKAAQETDAWEILQFVHGGELRLQPEFIVYPYFFMRGATFDDWFDLNLKFIELGNSALGIENGAAQIVVARDILLSDRRRQQLADAYGALPLSTIFLWVDSFSEHDAGEDELDAVFDLVRQLSATGKNVINLYGGFYSIVLCHSSVGALYGVSHGPQYGEDRGVVPVGGGLPTARFYLRALHHRIRFADALRILRRHGWLQSETAYFENVCNCRECVRLIQKFGVEDGFLQYGQSKPVTFQRGGSTVTMNYPLRETQVSATKHYLYCKEWEFKIVREKSVIDILERFNRAKEQFEGTLGLDAVAHLENWATVIERHV